MPGRDRYRESYEYFTKGRRNNLFPRGQGGVMDLVDEMIKPEGGFGLIQRL